MEDNDLLRQRQMVDVLASVVRNGGGTARLFETHISLVLVTDTFAYKFKKPLHVEFLDYSTLQKRQFFCEEELRLNRRLAPDIYLAVSPVTGTASQPTIDGDGPVVDYAVKMRSFDQQALWSNRLAAGILTADEVDALALLLARFHLAAAAEPVDSAYGTPDEIEAIADANLKDLATLAPPSDRELVSAMAEWTQAHIAPLRALFVGRKQEGWIRQCHGDLHSANVLTVDGKVQAFDCVEFNHSLSRIDVMNDAAFICMDLACQGRADFAARLLSRYLEETGDYSGLAVLRYYEVQRALVRAKISLMRVSQLREPIEARAQEEWGRRYLTVASRLAAAGRPALVITHGFSGSGKTTFARALVESAGAVQLRSDVERKRMHGMAADDRSGAAAPLSQLSRLYDVAVTRDVYSRLLRLAIDVLESGRVAVVDAAFLLAEQRTAFQHLAIERDVPYVVAHTMAGSDLMHQRLVARLAAGKDASDAGPEILQHQLAHGEPLSARERIHEVIIDMNEARTADALHTACMPVLERIGLANP